MAAGKDARLHRFGFAIAVFAIGVAAFFASMAGVASASAIGKGGKIYACYATKGPPAERGAVRLVGKKQRCHRGERKVYWSVAGPTGAAGQNGTNGTNGSTSTDTTQSNQIKTLTDQVTALQSILAGLSHQQLLDAISNAAKLDGISASTLTQLVGTLPIVSSLCAQTSALTSQANALRQVLSGLGLNTILAVTLVVPALPAALPGYSCPS